MAKSKDTKNYSYDYKEVGFKYCINECAYPKQYSQVSSRKAIKILTFGYKKQAGHSNRTIIDESTVEKSKMYLKEEKGSGCWLEIKYKRTRKSK